MYNGHKNWNQWNVSLWINNDEGLYWKACEFRRKYRAPQAAKAMLELLDDLGMEKMPDGARYNVTALKNAMSGM